MATIADLLIKIGADSSGLSSELGKSKEEISKAFSTSPINEFGNSIDSASGKLSGMFGSLTKMAALAAGGFGLNSIVQAAVEAGEAVYQMSQQYNMSASQASQLNMVMKMTGGSAETAASAMMRFDKQLTSGSKEGQQAQNILQAMGLSMTDASGKLRPLNEQMEQLAKGYKMAQEQGMGQEFIMQTLGVRGMALTKTLQNYEEAAGRASKIKGVGLDPEEMHKAYMDMQEVNIQMSKLGTVAGSALAPIVSNLLPGVQKELAGTASWIANNKELVSSGIVELTKLVAIYEAVKLAKKGISTVSDVWQKVNDTGVNKIEETALTKTQEKQINDAVKAKNKMYADQRKEAIKTAQQENMSAAETQAFLNEKFTQIGIKAAESAEEIRASMTAAFRDAAAQAQMSSDEIALAMGETTSRTAASNAEMAASETGVNTATQQSAAIKQEAANTKVAANARVVVSNGEVAESEVRTGTAAEEAAAVKAESATAKTGANERVIVSNTGVAESELRTGTAAEEAAVLKGEAVATEIGANERLAASNMGVKESAVTAGATTAATAATATSAIGTTTNETKKLAAAHVVQGQAGANAMKTVVTQASKVPGTLSKVIGAVSMLAGGWLGVAAACLYALYALHQYIQGEKEYKENHTVSYDGREWSKDSGGTWRLAGNGDVEVDPMGTGVAASATPDVDKLNEILAAQEKKKADDAKAAADAAEEERKRKMNESIADALKGFKDAADSSGGGGSRHTTEKEEPYNINNGALYQANELTQKNVMYGNQEGQLVCTTSIMKVWGDAGDPNITNAMRWAPNWESLQGYHSWEKGDYYNGQNGDAYLVNGSDGPKSHIVMKAPGGYYAAAGEGKSFQYYEGNPEDIFKVYGVVSLAEHAGITGSSGKQIVPTDNSFAAQAVNYLVNKGYDRNFSIGYAGGLMKESGGNTENLDPTAENSNGAYGISQWLDRRPGLEKYAKDNNLPVNDFYTQMAYLVQELQTTEKANYLKVMAEAGANATPADYAKLIDKYITRSEGTPAIRDEKANNAMALQQRMEIGGTSYYQQQIKAMAAARKEYSQLIADMQSGLTQDTGTVYEQGMAKIEADIKAKEAKLQEIKKAGGVDTSQGQKMLEEYKAAETKKLNDLIAQNWKKLKDETAQINADMKGDYKAMSDAEFDKTVDTIDKERAEKLKSIAKYKGDIEAIKAVDDWYTAEYLSAIEKRQEAEEAAFDKELKRNVSKRNASRIAELLNSQQNTDNAKRKNQEKSLQEYVNLYEDATVNIQGITEQAAASFASGLNSMFSELGTNINSVGDLAESMGKIIMSTIAQIVAKWAAAKITMGLFGGSLLGNTVSASLGSYGVDTSWDGGKYSNSALNASSYFSIPKFAKGALITAPTLGMIGEGTDDEGIYPLNNETYSSMAQGIVNAQGGNNQGGNAPVVNIINNSSSTVSVKDIHYDGSLRRWILNALVEDVNNNVDGAGTNLAAALKSR
jgi:hypothetical protein